MQNYIHMKKIKLFTLIILLVKIGLLNAQTDQGKILLGASSDLGAPLTGSNFIGYSSARDKGDQLGFMESIPSKGISISLLPKVGYFVADNLALGLDFNYTLSTRRSGVSFDTRSSQRMISAGPFLRYYIPMTKVLPYVEINSLFGRAKNKWGSGGHSTINLTSFGAGIGLAIPLTDSFAFDVLAGFNSVTQTSNHSNLQNFRIVSDNLGLKIGFTMFLGSN